MTTTFRRLNGIHCGAGKLNPQSDLAGISKYLGSFATYEQCETAAINDPSSNLFYSITYVNAGTTASGGYNRNCHAIINPDATTFASDSNMICGLSNTRLDNIRLNVFTCPTCPSGPTGCAPCPSGPTGATGCAPCPSGGTGATGCPRCPTPPPPCASTTPYLTGIIIVGVIAFILFVILMLKFLKVF